MMKRKPWMAWTLALALAASPALSALAASTETGEETPVAVEAYGIEETAESNVDGALAGPDDGGVREPDIIDRPETVEAQRDAEKLEKVVKEVTQEPVALEKVSFDQVEGLMRQNNLQIRSFQESIDYLQTLNYEFLSDQLREQINQTVDTQFQLMRLSEAPSASLAAQSTYASAQLEQSYTALRTMFDDIKEGKTQRDNAGVVRQLRAYQDQIILGGESLYVTIAGLETQRTALKRQLAALDRTVEEMTLRKNLGQISDLQLREITGGRAQLASGIATLEMNVKNLKYQLESLLGAGLTGTISLGSVPAVTPEQLEAMNEEADLQRAKAASYDLYAASVTLWNAQETYKDTASSVGYAESHPTYQKALMDWKTAQNTYNGTLQSFELKFRALYGQVKDYYQVWVAAQAALEDQRASYQASELKRSQGKLSENALLSAKDELTTAEEAVALAANDLFAAYNTYCWAVEHGVLN